MAWSAGAVAVEFPDVPQRHCFSILALYFDTLLGIGTQKPESFFFYMSF